MGRWGKEKGFVEVDVGFGEERGVFEGGVGEAEGGLFFLSGKVSAVFDMVGLKERDGVERCGLHRRL